MPKPKICYFIPSLWNAGGMERILTIKANYLVTEMGYDVTIVTTDQNEKPTFFKLDNDVKQINVPFAVNTNKKNNLVNRFLLNQQKSEYKSFVEKLLESEDFDICISMMGGADFGFLPTIKDKSVKIAELHFSIGFNKLMTSNILKKIYFYLVEKKFYYYARRFAHIVVLTGKDKENLVSHVRNTIVIPNPITIVPPSFADPENKVIIFVGRLEFEKGLDILLQIWEIVSKEIDGWELRIFGSGSQEDEIKRVISEKKLKNIEIYAPTPNIANEYQKASIFVMTSRSEGFPLALLESMAFGIAPISFDCPNGPKEIIGDGENGVLIENGNVNDFAKELTNLIQNINYRQKIAVNAKNRAAIFSVSEVMQKWQRLFDNTQL